MAIFMPTNQKRLTNVSIVRLRKGGKRFEVATYPNKVQAWRDHLETDLDEVLQTQTIFLNVSKGEEAKKDILEKVFDTCDKEEICKQILLKGEIQVTGRERHSNLDSLFSDVAKIISQKCINPSTQRAYSVAIIEKAMRACHVKLLPTRSAKQQATEVIGILQESGELNLEVTLLHVHLELTIGDKVSVATAHRVRKIVEQDAAEVLINDLDESLDLKMEFLVEPGALNVVEGRIRDETRGRYQMDISRSDMTKSTIAPKDEAGPQTAEKEITEKVAGMSINAAGGDKAEGLKKRRRRAKKGKDSESVEREAPKEVKENSDDDWEDSHQKRRGRRGKKGHQGQKEPQKKAVNVPQKSRDFEGSDSPNENIENDDNDVGSRDRRKKGGKRDTQT